MHCWSWGLARILYLYNTYTLCTGLHFSMTGKVIHSQEMKDLIPHPYSYCFHGVPTKCLHECEAIRRREDVFLLYSVLTSKKATVMTALTPWILFQSLRTCLKGYLVNPLLRKYSPICENHRRNPGVREGFSELSKSLLLKTGQCRLRERRPGNIWKEDTSDPKVETQASDCVYLVAIY